MPGPPTATSVDLDVIARLRIAVARLNRQLRQHSGTGIPLTLQSAMVTIGKHGPLTLGALAAIEQVAPATVTKIVTTLASGGLVERTADPTDGRVTRVSLSEAGTARLDESRSRRNAFLATQLDFPDAPTEDELRAAADVLERLARPMPDSR